MNIILPIMYRIFQLSPILFVYALIYYKALSFTKIPAYMNSFIHTIVLLCWLSLSYDNIKYVIPWSQSYFIFDTTVCVYTLSKPVIINTYNKTGVYVVKLGGLNAQQGLYIASLHLAGTQHSERCIKWK